MKLVATLLLFVSYCFAGAQTILTSTTIELINPVGKHDSAIAVDKNTNNLFVFVADKKSFHAIKYNSAQFFKDSITALRPNNDVDFIAGYSFNSDGQPTVYWQSDNLKIVRAVSFNFDDKTSSTALHNINFDGDSYIGSFSHNKAFYIISVPDNSSQIRFYEFRSGVLTQKTIDLPAAGNSLALSELFERYYLTRIESDAVNPLFICAEKVKYYIFDNKFLLTSDHNTTETQLFEIDLDNYFVRSKKFIQPTLATGPGDSNSLLHANVLYQIKTNKDQLSLSLTNIVTDSLIRTTSVAKTESIEFSNSPLLSQTANHRAKTFKDTKRFLRALQIASPAISAYAVLDATLLTVGGTTEVASTGNILLGVTAGVGMVLAGTDIYLDDLVDSDNLRTIFFETHLDRNHAFIKKGRDLLAADKISEFTNSNNKISLFTVVPFKGYYIGGYYVKAENKYYLRKFADGYQD